MVGGAIRVSLTGVVSRVNMDRWADILLRTLIANKVETVLFGKYLGDIDKEIDIDKWSRERYGERAT